MVQQLLSGPAAFKDRTQNKLRIWNQWRVSSSLAVSNPDAHQEQAMNQNLGVGPGKITFSEVSPRNAYERSHVTTTDKLSFCCCC